MAAFQYSHCQRLKTAIAERIQEIVASTERTLRDDNESFVKSRLPRGEYDPSNGPNPRKLRYGFAPAEERTYEPILSQGKVNGDMEGRGCNGEDGEHNVEIDKVGAYGCDLPGQQLQGGFDQFTYELKGKAFETDWVCALDLLLKNAYNEYLTGLQRALKKEAMRHHNWALERDVINLAKYNTSVTTGFNFAQGGFIEAPTGGLNVETIRRMFAVLHAEGWTGPQVVGGVSEEAFEYMRRTYKAQHDMNLETTAASMETEFLPKDATAVNWAGITWVFSRFPLRGYLQNGEFKPVRPTITRPGTGGGIVSEVNQGYYDCKHYCDGQVHDLYEAGFIIHPEFAKVLSFRMPNVAGKSWSGQLFNLDLRMIDGDTVTSRFGIGNTDNFKFFFRALDAYSFEPENPELAGAVLYLASPDAPVAVAPTCNSTAENPGEATIDYADAKPQEKDGQQDCGDPNAAECALDSYPVVPSPTEAEPCPTPVVGTIRFADCGGVNVPAPDGEDVVIQLCVERVGGTSGAASSEIDTTGGTATFTAIVDEAQAWVDMEGGDKCVTLTIDAASAAGQTVLLEVNTFVGAAEGDCSTLAVTLV